MEHTMNNNDNEQMVFGLFLWAVIALVIAFTLTGCNTIAGLGKDVHLAAKGIQEKMATPSDYNGANFNND
tara:strand:- start:1032 stop:1241 length:210 start_codon:yes stop_codon:yes gene_type:complete